MLKYSKGRWANQWACIEIDPFETNEYYEYFLRVLFHISATYHLDFPKGTGTLDGFIAEFEILGSAVIMHMDNYTFSVAFMAENVRDQVLAELQALPPDYFYIKQS